MRELFSLFAFAFIFALAACEAAPTKPLEQMSSAELEQVIAKGGVSAEAAAMRVSSSYMRYGSAEQRMRAAGYMLALSAKGNREATLRLCQDDYIYVAGEAALQACRKITDEKEGKAYAAFCRHAASAEERLDMCRLAALSGEVDGYIPMGREFITQGDPQGAYEWLMKALEEGSPEQRDMAIAELSGLTGAPQNLFGPESRRKPDRAYEPISTPAPEARGFTAKGQCYVRYSVTPTGHPFEIFVECSHKELTQEVRDTVHDWRFEPAKAGPYPVFMLNDSTTIYFNHD